MANDVTFKFMQIVVNKKARNRKILPQLRNARKDTVIIELTYSYVTGKMMRPIFQSSTALKLNSAYQSGKLIKTNVNVHRKGTTKLRYGGGNVIRAEMRDQNH